MRPGRATPDIGRIAGFSARALPVLGVPRADRGVARMRRPRRGSRRRACAGAPRRDGRRCAARGRAAARSPRCGGPRRGASSTSVSRGVSPAAFSRVARRGPRVTPLAPRARSRRVASCAAGRAPSSCRVVSARRQRVLVVRLDQRQRRLVRGGGRAPTRLRPPPTCPRRARAHRGSVVSSSRVYRETGEQRARTEFVRHRPQLRGRERRQAHALSLLRHRRCAARARRPRPARPRVRGAHRGRPPERRLRRLRRGLRPRPGRHAGPVRARARRGPRGAATGTPAGHGAGAPRSRRPRPTVRGRARSAPRSRGR